jgi:transcriptional regulator with XRE-family HTH domain
MISKNLLRLRKQYEMSQEQVAEAIQVSRQAVAKWENGDSIPDAVNCIALADLFQVTVDDLLRYDESATHLRLPIPPKGKHFFGIATIGERGQIVIPKKARTVFNLKPFLS